MGSENLWGDVSTIVPSKSPVSILKEQGETLRQLTSGQLYGEVAAKENGTEFGYSLHIVAPGLNGYRYHVLNIYHDVMLYPLQITKEPDSSYLVRCASEEEYVQHLKKFLTSPKIHSVISGLLTHLNSLSQV